MADYVFHVLHNARPEYEMDILAILQDGSESTYEGILSEGRSIGLLVGFQIRTERMLRDILQPLRDLDLVERRQIRLTDAGQTLAQISCTNPDLFPEIFHYLYYSAWKSDQKTQKCFSWSYRNICNHLWGQGSLALDKKGLASSLSSEASQRFEIRDVSVSTKTINGILIWLEALSPPVVEYEDGQSEGMFSRRSFCSPELFVLGVDFAYRIEGADYGTNLLLSDERRGTICQICLLEPEGFDRVLEYAVAQFDYLDRGLGGGWGHYLTLHHAPRLENFVE
jgi:hypothetical protein